MPASRLMTIAWSVRIATAEQPQRAVSACDADRVAVDRVPGTGRRRARGVEEEKRGRAQRREHERRPGCHRDRRQERDGDEAVQKHEQGPDGALRITRQQVGNLESCGKASRNLRGVDDERRSGRAVSHGDPIGGGARRTTPRTRAIHHSTRTACPTRWRSPKNSAIPHMR